MSELTFLDWMVLVIIACSVVTSIIRGFVREVLGLVTVVGAFLLAAWFYAPVGHLFDGFLRTEGQALFAGFALVFVATLIAGFGLIRLIRKFFRFAHIQWFDRVLGGAFGFVRGWLIAAVIFLTLTAFGVQSEAVREARLAPYFLPAVRIVASMTPFDLRARFLIGYEEVRRWWDERS